MLLNTTSFAVTTQTFLGGDSKWFKEYSERPLLDGCLAWPPLSQQGSDGSVTLHHVGLAALDVQLSALGVVKHINGVVSAKVVQEALLGSCQLVMEAARHQETPPHHIYFLGRSVDLGACVQGVIHAQGGCPACV